MYDNHMYEWYMRLSRNPELPLAERDRLKRLARDYWQHWVLWAYVRPQ